MKQDIEVLKVNEVCKILRQSKPTIYKLFGSGQLKHVRIGNRYYTTKGNIADFLSGEKQIRN